MAKRYQNKRHMQWIHEQPCVIDASTRTHTDCDGPVQAHHLLKPWHGERGMGLKADDRNLVPLCMRHHTLLHDKYGDEFEFFYELTNHPEYGQDKAADYWYSSPYFEPDKELEDPPF